MVHLQAPQRKCAPWGEQDVGQVRRGLTLFTEEEAASRDCGSCFILLVKGAPVQHRA